MSQINFLPVSFVSQARRRRRKYRHAVMLAIVAAGLVGWGFVERGKNIRPQQRAFALEAEVETARYQMNEFVKLKMERDTLLQQQRIKDELSQPVSHTEVISMLARHLPPSVGLTDLQIVTERPVSNAPSTKSTSSRSKSKKTASVAPVVDELRIELDALAPDDVTIANLIGELSEDSLFDRVTLKYSRTTDARGVEGRLFKLLMRVRLDRRFEVEVADAH